MRIVQVANFYTPASGGLRTCVDEIGRGYLAAGHDRVLVVPGLTDADETTSAGRRITLRGPRFGSAGYHVLTARRTRSVLESLRPDVIECSDKLSVRWLAPWARRTGIPLVLFSHERIDAILRSRVPRGFPLVTAADLANRRLSVRAEHIVVASGFAAAEFVRIGADNVHRIPLGVDLSTFRPADPSMASPGTIEPRSTAAYFGEQPGSRGMRTMQAARGRWSAADHRPPHSVPSGRPRPAEQHGIVRAAPGVPRAGITPGRPHAEVSPSHSTAEPTRPQQNTLRHGVRPAPVRLVTVSRLSREKCPELAVAVVQLLHESGIPAELTMIGDGPLRERLHECAAGLPVTFLGHVSDRDLVAATVAHADFAICPSPVETFGLSVLEALACGTPVIVPEAGAARELLGAPGSGIACAGTPAGLAAGVRTLLTIPAERRRRAARHSAERFPWSATIAGMLAIYAGYQPDELSA